MYDYKSSLTEVQLTILMALFLVSLLCYESVVNVKNDVSVF